MTAAARLLVPLLGWICFCVPSRSLADGKVFRPVEYAVDPVIPDQRALLHWMDGQETLVIETSVHGGGENLAWVVPFPAPPEVEAAPNGLFESVAAAFAPTAAEVKPRILYWMGGALTLLVRWPPRRWKAGPGSSPRILGLLVPILIIVVATAEGKPELGYFLAALLTWPATFFVSVIRNRGIIRGRGRWELVPVLVLVCISVVAFLFLGTGRIMGGPDVKGAGGDSGVRVLGVRDVGDFHATILRGDTGAALSGWLGENGYALPPDTLPAVDSYVRDGWVFVAMKVKRSVERAALPLHPVTFRFPCREPVYPMRLTATATGGRPLLLDLFVLGPASAEAPGLTVKRGDRMRNLARWRNPEFSRWIGSAGVGTWLRGELTGETLKQDVRPRWIEAETIAPVAHTGWSALVSSLNLGGPFLLVAGLLMIYSPRISWNRCAVILPLGIAGLALGGMRFASLEIRDFEGGGGGYHLHFILDQMSSRLADSAPARAVPGGDDRKESRGLRAEELATEARKHMGRILVETADSGGPRERVLILDTPAGVEGWWRSPDGERYLLMAWDKAGEWDFRPGRRPYHMTGGVY